MFSLLQRNLHNNVVHDRHAHGTSTADNITTLRSCPAPNYGTFSIRGENNGARANRDNSTSTTRGRSTIDASSLEDEAHFIWEDINPPEGHVHSVHRRPSTRRLQERSSPCERRGTHGVPFPETSSADLPPAYNDVSGAVVVDWDGSPRFLSPEEEEERKARLQRAVRERMLGLPRQTEFDWARPEERSETLPKYSAEDGT